MIISVFGYKCKYFQREDSIMKSSGFHDKIIEAFLMNKYQIKHGFYLYDIKVPKIYTNKSVYHLNFRSLYIILLLINHNVSGNLNLINPFKKKKIKRIFGEAKV